MDDLPSLSHLFKLNLPSALELITRQALLIKGDETLTGEITSALFRLVSQGAVPAQAPILVSVPEYTMVGQWMQLYCDAINRPALQKWASEQNLELPGLIFRASQLHATVLKNGKRTPHIFTLADNSGWWNVATPLLDMLQIIDTHDAGLPYFPPCLAHGPKELPLELVLAFYGYPVLHNHLQAQAVLKEIVTLDALPGLDDSGRLKTTLPGELTEELRDYSQLASALQQLLQSREDQDEPFDWLQVYQQRLTLGSDSMLATTLRRAAKLLRELVKGEELLAANPVSEGADPIYHYALDKQAIIAVSQGNGATTSPVDRTDNSPLNQQWDELTRLASLANQDIHPDASLSLAAMMIVYRLDRPLNNHDARAMIERLRSARRDNLPYVSAEAHSITAVGKYKRHIAVLNDRYHLQAALRSVSLDEQLESTLGMACQLAEQSPFATLVEQGALQLRGIRHEPALRQLSATLSVDPEGLLLLSAGGQLRGHTVDGQPITLTSASQPLSSLTALADPLLELARQTGGQLRSDGQLSVRQLLTLYGVDVPGSSKEAKACSRLLDIPVIKSPLMGNYWKALKVLPLLSKQRQLVMQTVKSFLPNEDVTLFDFLSAPVLGDRTRDQVRDDADVLLMRLLGSIEAQSLAARLSAAVPWHGLHATALNTRESRNALLFAALILSLDANAGARCKVAGYDLTDQYNWGLTFDEVRGIVEALVQMKIANNTAAPMAAHLLLAGVAPEFLVRDIPDEVSYMSSHTWVHFKQYVDIVEARMPGTSRTMRFTDFMAIIYFVKAPQRVRYGSVPITDWAVANGVLRKSGEPRSTTEKNRAIAALNEQINLLHTSAALIEAPAPSLYEIALQDLRRVFPGNQHLQERVLKWQAPRAGATPAPNVPANTTVSLLDLHMAGLLQPHNVHWRASSPDVDFASMAQHFGQLSAIHTAFGAEFKQRHDSVRTALVQSILYWLSQLPLPSRELMEHGDMEFYSLRKPKTPNDATARFGVLTCCRYFDDTRFYEFFPKHLNIASRPDLTFALFNKATGPGSEKGAQLPVDWAAYHLGTNPLQKQQSTVIVERFAHLPVVLGSSPEVPNTFTSPRSLEIATIIVDQHVLRGAALVLAASLLPLPLIDAISGRDRRVDFLRQLMPPSIK